MNRLTPIALSGLVAAALAATILASPAHATATPRHATVAPTRDCAVPGKTYKSGETTTSESPLGGTQKIVCTAFGWVPF